MARYSGGAKTAGAGSTTLPLMSLYSGAAGVGKLVEVGIYNTTVTAYDVKLVRLTTAGTQGANLVEAPWDLDIGAASCTLVGTHTVGPTLGADLGYRASIGAGIGSGTIWTFGERGIRIPVGTANGIGIIIENGTGQISQIYWVWDE